MRKGREREREREAQAAEKGTENLFKSKRERGEGVREEPLAEKINLILDRKNNRFITEYFIAQKQKTCLSCF